MFVESKLLCFSVVESVSFVSNLHVSFDIPTYDVNKIFIIFSKEISKPVYP